MYVTKVGSVDVQRCEQATVQRYSFSLIRGDGLSCSVCHSYSRRDP